MTGLSTIVNATAGAINGYRNQQYVQNAEDFAQAQRANQEALMDAQQTTYQPQAQAQVAQAGLSQAQANGQAALVPGATNVALTNQATQQSAANSALQRQPLVNQTASNQATVQAGVSGTQAALVPQVQTNMSLGQLSQDDQAHVQAISGLYGAMMGGPDATKQYVQKVIDSGAYPNLAGKQVGQVGLTPDGQTFVAQDAQGNQLLALPTQSIRAARAATIPTQWQDVKPGSTLIGTQGGQITSQTTAPVPDAFSAQHAGVVVNTANWLMKNMPQLKPQDAFNMAKQANTMSREQFVSTIMGNPMLNTDMTNPAASAQKFGAIYDQLRAQNGGGTPGLSSMPASNTSGNDIIDSLIGGANPAATASNPYAPNPDQ